MRFTATNHPKNTIQNKKAQNSGQDNITKKPQSSNMKKPTMGSSPATSGDQGRSKEWKLTLIDVGKSQTKLMGARGGPRKSRSTSRNTRSKSSTRTPKPKEPGKSRSHSRERIEILEGERGVSVKKEMMEEEIRKRSLQKGKGRVWKSSNLTVRIKKEKGITSSYPLTQEVKKKGKWRLKKPTSKRNTSLKRKR